MRQVLRARESCRQSSGATAGDDPARGRPENGDGGDTALWFAAQGPWPHGLEVVKALVEAGADGTPAEMARARGQQGGADPYASRGL